MTAWSSSHARRRRQRDCDWSATNCTGRRSKDATSRCNSMRSRRSTICRSDYAVELWRGDVPDIIDAVAADIAGIAVLVIGIDRLALVGPLFAAVGTSDDAPVARWLGVGGYCKRRPFRCALIVAVRRAGGVAVERVERHACATDERFALGRVACRRRCGLRERCGDAE